VIQLVREFRLRLWSLHPKYLDAKGLVALWREGLLAKKVLENRTRGYRNHPQLDRFRKLVSTLSYINAYLHYVCDEADQRGYKFDRSKLLQRVSEIPKAPVQSGQIAFEWGHLLNKLKTRSPEKYGIVKLIKNPNVHPIFKKVRGGVEPWEII
jgi:hypothetical protein